MTRFYAVEQISPGFCHAGLAPESRAIYALIPIDSGASPEIHKTPEYVVLPIATQSGRISSDDRNRQFITNILLVYQLKRLRMTIGYYNL